MAIYSGYQGAKSCTKGPSTGAQGLMSWFLAKYADDGGLNAGIYNCRTVRGGKTTSLHGEGRAADLAIRPYRATYGTQLANLLRTHSKELGIQCIIWNRKIWSGLYTDWREYTGVNAHVDHLHVELSWTSANMSKKAMIDLLEKTLGSKVDGEVPAEKPAEKVWQNSKNSKEDNVAIAKTLNALGFYAGEPDGVPGTYLRDGVKSYQRSQIYFPGLKADGDWSKLTQQHFEWVKKLQKTVSEWKASERLGKLFDDGDYRSVTGNHVRAVQSSNTKLYAKKGGKRVDNIAGPIFCRMIGIRNHPMA